MKKFLGLIFCLVFIFGSTGISSLQPKPVIKLSTHQNCGSVLLTWSGVVGAVGYDVYRMDEGQSLFTRIVQLNTEKLYYRDTKNAVSGKKFKYYVSAVGDESVEIAKSPEMTAIPDCYDESSCFVSLKFQVGNFMYWVNDRMEGPMDAGPEQTNGRVFLVIKYITKALGVKLDWLASDKKVTITTPAGRVIELWIGKNKARINGVEAMIDEKNPKVAPYLSNGRTMLPMRFVGDNLGATEIKWDDPTKMATISLPVDCNEPDCYNLTVESFTDSEVTASNSSGARIRFDKSIMAQGSVAIGEMVRVCGVFEFKDDSIWINPRAGKRIDLSKLEFFRGYVESVNLDKNEITIKTCEGAIKTFAFKSDSGVGTVMKTLPVILLVLGNTAVSWKYIEREKVCEGQTIDSASMAITEVNCDKGYIAGEIVGKTPPEVFKIYMPSKEWCGIQVGACLRISYFVDGLGHPIAASMKETACPCDFEIIMAKTQIKSTTGSGFLMEFKVKNTGKFEGDFVPFVSGTDFPGDVKITPEKETLKPEQTGFFKIMGKVSDDFDGLHEFDIGVKCREASQTKAVKLEVSPPIFQVGSASGNTSVATDENINLNFDVTNYSEGPITVTAMVESSDFPGKLSVEPMTKEVPDKNTRTFTIIGQWNPGAKVGQIYNISYWAQCGRVVKKGKTQVSSLAPGPVVTLVDGTGNPKGLTVIDGSINWKHYTKSKIEVEWGDGSKEDVKGIPALHQYKKKGEFNVKVTAYTKEGVSTSAACKCFWAGPIPVITFGEPTWSDPTLTLRGSIDWNTLTPDKLLVDWADGKKDTFKDFPVSHAYHTVGDFIIVMTAVSKTGEEGVEYFLFRLRWGLNSRSVIYSGAASAY